MFNNISQKLFEERCCTEMCSNLDGFLYKCIEWIKNQPGWVHPYLGLLCVTGLWNKLPWCVLSEITVVNLTTNRVILSIHKSAKQVHWVGCTHLINSGMFVVLQKISKLFVHIFWQVILDTMLPSFHYRWLCHYMSDKPNATMQVANFQVMSLASCRGRYIKETFSKA